MRVSYKRLWKLLIDYDMSQAELRQKAGIAPNTMTKLRRNQALAMCVLIKICSTLNVNIGDVMDLIPETETDRLWGEKNESEL